MIHLGIEGAIVNKLGQRHANFSFYLLAIRALTGALVLA
jgi:hypothetical protein